MSLYKPLPAYEKVRDCFDYDSASGCLLWKRTAKSLNCYAGEPAGSITWYGYCSIYFCGEKYMAHRLMWLWHTGNDPGDKQVDHRDRDRLNNCIENLRLGTSQDQKRNTASVGVGWHNAAGKWRAYITIDRKDIHLGLFVILEDAVRARLLAEIHHFGEWAPTSCEDFEEELHARMSKLKNLKRRLKSKSVGVSYYKRARKWAAYLYCRGEQHWLGYHRTKAEALAARHKAEVQFGVL